MRRTLAMLVVFAALLSVGVVAAQNQASPTPASGTPTRLCASPVAAASTTPVLTTTAPAPAASPGGVGAGETVGLYPCGTPTTAAAAAPLALALQDIKFSVKELSITANTDAVIALTNEGATVHNFNIDELNIHSGDVQPGASLSVTINAKPGDYQYYCNIPGHKEAGMIGVLHVK